jgi:hypothetical protein
MLGDVGSVLSLIAVMAFVVCTLALAAFALVRPFTHVHYRHTDDRHWSPLD